MMISLVQLDAGLAMPCGNCAGVMIREGNSAIRLTGDFETKDYVPVLVWNADLVIGEDPVCFWPVYEKDSAAELRYTIRKMDGRSGKILYQMRMEEPDLTKPVFLDRGLSSVKDGQPETGRYQIVLEVKIPDRKFPDPARAGQEVSTAESAPPSAVRPHPADSVPADHPETSSVSTSAKKETEAEKEQPLQEGEWLRIGPIHLYSVHAPWLMSAGKNDPGKKQQEICLQKESGKRKMEIIATPDRCEVFALYQKGDGKPPLRVLFAGTKSSSLELAEKMLEKTSSPCLLLADARLQGEGFWLGTPEYESAIKDTIVRYLKELDFTGDEIILSGISFGAAGALYYGADLNPAPRAILLAEPVLNTGSMVMKEKFDRNGSFPKSLDMYLLMRHDFGVEDNQTQRDVEKALNDHIWNRVRDRIRKGNFSQTEIAACYMQEDEYDGSAFEDLRRELSAADPPVRVYGKRKSGRHIPEENKEISTVVDWLEQRFMNIARKWAAQDTAEGM